MLRHIKLSENENASRDFCDLNHSFHPRRPHFSTTNSVMEALLVEGKDINGLKEVTWHVNRAHSWSHHDHR
jgi:hypothetical protein